MSSMIPDRKYSSEQGSISVLAAVLAVVFIVLVAMSVDIGGVTSASEEVTNAGNLSLLKGLESYFASVEVTHGGRMNDALAAINNFTDKNGALSLAPGTKINAGLDVSDPLRLEAGKVFYELPADGRCANNPCELNNNTLKNYPCFASYDHLAAPAASGGCGYPADELKVTSLRLKGQVASEGAKPWFTQLLTGDTEINLPIEAVATAVPRQGCFVIDISPSMTYGTHEQSGEPRYAYSLDSANGGAGTGTTGHQALYDSLPAARGAGDTTYINNHFKDDYYTFNPLVNADEQVLPDVSYDNNESAPFDVAFKLQKHHPAPTSPLPAPAGNNFTLGNVDYSSIAISSKNYTLDTYSDGTDAQAPNPMDVVFKAVKTAILQAKERAVGGDKLCLIFHDNTLAWPRVFTLTDEWEYLEGVFDSSTSVWDAVNDLDFTSGRGLQARYGLFPTSGYTNLGLALTEAQRQFTDPGLATLSAQVQNFVVVFGDGLLNCSYSKGACNNNYTFFTSATAEIKTLATLFRDQHIPVHSVQIGDHVAPHFKMIPIDRNSDGTNDGCMTDEESRQQTEDFVKLETYGTAAAGQTAFIGASEANPFYNAADPLYSLSLITGGYWLPLLKEDSDPGQVNCSACVDGQRQLYSCKSQDDQITEAIQKVMGDTPYLLFSEMPESVQY
ncbi:MAG: hypothetical protein PHC51_05890 [bacterium]|nr:hypothetical protein [bacterium]